MPNLFTGRAYFTPSVPASTPTTWTTHGGTLTPSPHTAEYIFCAGRTDACYARLAARGVPVFHARWVVNVVRAGFVLPMAPYTLNGREHEREEAAAGEDHERQSEEPPAKRARRGSAESDRQSDFFDEGTTLVNEQSLDAVPPRSIPHIDLSKVPLNKRPSRNRLQIHVLSQNKAIPKKKQVSSSTPLLRFEVNEDGIPRISGADIRKALRHISLDKSAFIKHKREHLGKTFRCGFQP